MIVGILPWKIGFFRFFAGKKPVTSVWAFIRTSRSQLPRTSPCVMAPSPCWCFYCFGGIHIWRKHVDDVLHNRCKFYFYHEKECIENNHGNPWTLDKLALKLGDEWVHRNIAQHKIYCGNPKTMWLTCEKTLVGWVIHQLEEKQPLLYGCEEQGTGLKRLSRASKNSWAARITAGG